MRIDISIVVFVEFLICMTFYIIILTALIIAESNLKKPSFRFAGTVIRQDGPMHSCYDGSKFEHGLDSQQRRV